MEANELRIGNYVNLNDGSEKDDFRKITAISKNRAEVLVYGCLEVSSSRPISSYYPIKLTEELLLKCGFERQLETPWLLSNGMITLNTGNHNTWQYCQSVLKEIKYLHTLQNVFYALHQREMELKL